MSMERALEGGWEEVQRQGHDIAERVGALAQGLGCMLQSQIRFSGIPTILPVQSASDRPWYDEILPSSSASSWPWLFTPSNRTKALTNRVQLCGIHMIRGSKEDAVAQEKLHGSEGAVGIQDLGYRLGQVGAAVGVCVGGFMHSAMTQISWPFQAESATEALHDFLYPCAPISAECGNRMEPRAFDDKIGSLPSRDLTHSGPFSAAEEDLEEVSDCEEDYEDASDTPIASHEQFHALLTSTHQHLHRQNGVHSLCPAIWSKQRRWLLMSMLCLNPFTCSFLDFQFPNGQCTYIAGEGLASGAFVHAFGGLIQAQGRYPGDMKVSFSKKVGWGTRITPVLQLPEKSLSLDFVQQIAWQRSGAMVRPTIELSVAPTFGGRNAGWRAEVVHFPKEKLSMGGGFALTIQPTAFASVSIGRSKRNGSHSGNSGLELQVETPLDNFSRASFTVKLNSGVDF